jgi:hypothetical protein
MESVAGEVFIEHRGEVVRVVDCENDCGRKDFRYVNTNYDCEIDIRDLPDDIQGAQAEKVTENDTMAHRIVLRRAIDVGFFRPG